MKREQYILELEQKVIRLISERDAAITRAHELEAENLEMKRKLAFYEGPDTPPSQETLNKKKKEKKKAKKKRGAPKGHRGATRKKPEPDETVVVPPATICPNCAKHPGEPTDIKKKVVEELVSSLIKAIEFIKRKHECQHCGFVFTTNHEDCPQKGDFGVDLLTYVTMLKYHLRGPYRRVEEFLLHQNNFEISTKGLMDMILRVGDACKEEYDKKHAKVKAARWVHIDETGIHVNGEKWWLWTFRTPEGDVLVVIRKSRGRKVVDEVLGKDYEGPAVVDGWRSYSHIKVVQRGWAHLLRRAEQHEDVSADGKRLSEELHEMFDDLKKYQGKKHPIDERKHRKQKFDREMEALVKKYGKFEELKNVTTYIRRGLGNWFTCLLYPGMEPTNNLAEQAIREHVIMKKIIGCFRSENGSQNYQYIASLLASWKLQGKNMFVELEKLLRRELCLR